MFQEPGEEPSMSSWLTDEERSVDHPLAFCASLDVSSKLTDVLVGMYVTETG